MLALGKGRLYRLRPQWNNTHSTRLARRFSQEQDSVT
jgi:hypothetical protein